VGNSLCGECGCTPLQLFVQSMLGTMMRVLDNNFVTIFVTEKCINASIHG